MSQNGKKKKRPFRRPIDALSQLRKDLRVAATPAAMAAAPRGPDWIDSARVALEAAVTSRHLLPTTALRCWLSWCLAEVFRFPAASHHLYGTVKALQQLMGYGSAKDVSGGSQHAGSSKNVPSLTRTAVAAALGELTRRHGGKVVSCAQGSVACLAKQLPLRELVLREAAVHALVAVVEGTTPVLPDPVVADVLKAVYAASKDKAPEVRAGAARVLRALATWCPGGVTTEKPAEAAKVSVKLESAS